MYLIERAEYNAVMELYCERFMETMDADDAVCQAPDEECRYRPTCMVFLVEKQREKEKKESR